MVTIVSASAPLFPLMLVYTAISLGVFRGKVRSTAQHY